MKMFEQYADGTASRKRAVDTGKLEDRIRAGAAKANDIKRKRKGL